MKNLFIIPFLLFSFANFTYANFCSADKKTEIYYVNGVDNSYDEARANLFILRRAYLNTLENTHPDETFNFQVSYNYSSGLYRDLMEVIGQKRNEINDPEVSKLTPEEYWYRYKTIADFKNSIPSLASPILSVIEDYLASRIAESVNARGLIQKYEADLLGGSRVLLVAHSQGNLFANQAVQTLQNKYANNIGLIGLANPATIIYNDSSYITAHDDRVIDLLRLIHSVLPSNIDNDPGIFNDFRDISNHQFARSYFDSRLKSRSVFDAEFNYYLNTLEFPDPDIENGGAITATLKWGPQPDLDLHVFEPDNTHVYYLNPQGSTGFLDLDDTSGFGPEHYYSSCENVKPGTYIIGVNYFSGSEPETAMLQITTADGVARSFSTSLSSSRGKSGNQTPIKMAEIQVVKNENDELSFQIMGIN